MLLLTVNAPGGEPIETLMVPAVPIQPFADAVTEYVPAFTVPTLLMVGFCRVEVKLLGPVQL